VLQLPQLQLPVTAAAAEATATATVVGAAATDRGARNTWRQERKLQTQPQAYITMEHEVTCIACDM